VPDILKCLRCISTSFAQQNLIASRVLPNDEAGEFMEAAILRQAELNAPRLKIC
jgi:hypothetical protein